MKRIVTFLLALALVLSLAACGKDNGGDATTTAKKEETKKETTKKEETKKDETKKEETTSAEPEEIPVLRINFHCIFDKWDAVEEVQAAVNELLREKAHAELEIVVVPVSDLKQQTNLMMSGGDDALDIILSSSYSTVGELVSNGQVIALDDLLESDGQGILNAFKGLEFALDCCKVDGKIYGLPAITAWSAPNAYLMFKEYADAAGMTEFPEHLDTIDEFTDLLIELKKASPDQYFIGGNNNLSWVPKDIDNLADSNNLGVLIDPANDSTVIDYYESDHFAHFLENVQKWVDNDLIYPDSYVTVAARSPLRTRVVAGNPLTSSSVKEMVNEYTVDQTYGADVVAVEIGPRIMTTGTVAGTPWHITSFCEDPAAAMRILNCLYSDPDVANTYMNGVEGSQYVVNEKGQLAWPEGKASQQDVGWMSGYNSTHPNGFITKTWYNMLPDAFDILKESNNEAKPSLALGFTVNLEPVADQYAACVNVVAKYYNALSLGAVDIAETLPIFQQELKNNGVDDIVAEKQAQLDKWLANK